MASIGVWSFILFFRIHSLTFICFFPLSLALFSSGDNSKGPGSLQRDGRGEQMDERLKKGGEEMEREIWSADSDCDIYLGQLQV